MVRKYLRGALFLLILLATAAGAGTYSFYQAAQHEPAFYRQAMRIEPQQQAQAGNELEQEVLELRNEVTSAGTWEAVFTEDQINGWLAADLPVKFPGMLPRGVDSPRVAIHDGEINVAARYEDKLVKSIVSVALDVCLTEETNTMAVTIKRIRAGMLPVPIRQFLDKIARTAAKGEIPLRWSQTEGDPVALVTIPCSRSDYAHRAIFVETIELREGAVFLAGRTDDLPVAPAEVQPEVRPESPPDGVPAAEIAPTEVAQQSSDFGPKTTFQR